MKILKSILAILITATVLLIGYIFAVEIYNVSTTEGIWNLLIGNGTEAQYVLLGLTWPNLAPWSDFFTPEMLAVNNMADLWAYLVIEGMFVLASIVLAFKSIGYVVNINLNSKRVKRIFIEDEY